MADLALKTKHLLDNGDACFFPLTQKAAQALGWRFYFNGKRCKNGHLSIRYTSSKECKTCRECKNQELKKQQKAWRLKNKERISALGKMRYYNNHEQELERSRRKWVKNPEKVTKTNKAWLAKNPGYVNYVAAKRRARLLNATPSWANMDEIKKFYAACPSGYHVDHIHPLQGKTICGFHVLENLQYLPASENQAKSNHFIPGHAL